MPRWWQLIPVHRHAGSSMTRCCAPEARTGHNQRMTHDDLCRLESSSGSVVLDVAAQTLTFEHVGSVATAEQKALSPLVVPLGAIASVECKPGYSTHWFWVVPRGIPPRRGGVPKDPTAWSAVRTRPSSPTGCGRRSRGPRRWTPSPWPQRFPRRLGGEVGGRSGQGLDRRLLQHPLISASRPPAARRADRRPRSVPLCGGTPPTPGGDRSPR